MASPPPPPLQLNRQGESESGLLKVTAEIPGFSILNLASHVLPMPPPPHLNQRDSQNEDADKPNRGSGPVLDKAWAH